MDALVLPDVMCLSLRHLLLFFSSSSSVPSSVGNALGKGMVPPDGYRISSVRGEKDVIEVDFSGLPSSRRHEDSDVDHLGINNEGRKETRQPKKKGKGKRRRGKERKGCFASLLTSD